MLHHSLYRHASFIASSTVPLPEDITPTNPTQSPEPLMPFCSSFRIVRPSSTPSQEHSWTIYQKRNEGNRHSNKLPTPLHYLKQEDDVHLPTQHGPPFLAPKILRRNSPASSPSTIEMDVPQTSDAFPSSETAAEHARTDMQEQLTSFASVPIPYLTDCLMSDVFHEASDNGLP